MGITFEQKSWIRSDLAAFERLPPAVRDALRYNTRKIDVRKLKKAAKTEAEMLQLIASGKAPLNC